jgi:predicted nucleic acid-binding protein
MFLLDTSVVSELRKGTSADAGLVAWASSTSVRSMSISVVTVHELEHGVRLLERRDQDQGQVLRRWLTDDVLPTFAGRILAVDGDVARIAGGLHVPDPAPVLDALIAATAIAHGLTVVTRNVRDFARWTNVSHLDPFGS